MSSAVLQWVANAVIGGVLGFTLWLAQAVQPQSEPVSLHLAVASPAPAGAASAPR